MLTPGFDAILLDLQYRMRASIARWPSSLFYGDKLNNAQSVKDLAPIPGFPWPADKSGVPFVHCDGEEGQQGFVIWNMSECKAVGTLIRKLLNAGVLPEDIGVITLYEGQRQKLRRRLNPRIEVKTLTLSRVEKTVHSNFFSSGRTETRLHYERTTSERSSYSCSAWFDSHGKLLEAVQRVGSRRLSVGFRERYV